MVTIKIHDKQWFKEHCRVVGATGYYSYLEPKYSPWRHVITLDWSLENTKMCQLTGKVLEVEKDDGDTTGCITDARYFAGGYWIPNWAIEWVKETE